MPRKIQLQELIAQIFESGYVTEAQLNKQRPLNHNELEL